jgi:YD repeat-containing protein
VQDFGFGYDLIGNLTSRTDTNTGLSETFTYDSLNRLRSATVGVDVAKTVSYDVVGNILSKSDVGTYSYPLARISHVTDSLSWSRVMIANGFGGSRAEWWRGARDRCRRPAEVFWVSVGLGRLPRAAHAASRVMTESRVRAGAVPRQDAIPQRRDRRMRRQSSPGAR